VYFLGRNFSSCVIVALGVLAVQVGWDVKAVAGYTIASLFIVIVMKIIKWITKLLPEKRVRSWAK
jgi:hypothetical protein